METIDQPKQTFEAVDITFHGRNLRSTMKFENAQKKAEAKNSKVIRVYGVPQFLLERETGLIYLSYRFSEDITKKIMDGTLVFPKGTPTLIDPETQKFIKAKEKRRLKNSTRVWRSPK